MIALPLGLAYFVTAALVWLYKSWEMLPESMRVTGNGTRVSPGQAVGYLFIPFYNLYWYFHLLGWPLHGAQSRARRLRVTEACLERPRDHRGDLPGHPVRELLLRALPLDRVHVQRRERKREYATSVRSGVAPTSTSNVTCLPIALVVRARLGVRGSGRVGDSGRMTTTTAHNEQAEPPARR